MPAPCTKRECECILRALEEGSSFREVSARFYRDVKTVKSIQARSEAGDRVVLRGKQDTVSAKRKLSAAVHSSLIDLVKRRETSYLDELAVKSTGLYDRPFSVCDVSRGLAEIGFTQKKANSHSLREVAPLTQGSLRCCLVHVTIRAQEADADRHLSFIQHRALCYAPHQLFYFDESACVCDCLAL